MTKRPLSMAAALLVATWVCSSAGLAQAQEGAYMMILLDTSSSMLQDTDVNLTYGDGSLRYPGDDTVIDANSEPDDSRLFIAKEVITEVVAGAGAIRFGLSRYYADVYDNYGIDDGNFSSVCPFYAGNQSPHAGDWECGGTTYDNVDYISADGWHTRDVLGECCRNTSTQWLPGYGNYQSCTTCTGSDCVCYDYDNDGDCDNDTFAGTPVEVGRGADILVSYDGAVAYDPNEILQWVDHTETYSGGVYTNPEIRATGFTPLARSMMDIRDHFRDDFSGSGGEPPAGSAGVPPCYRYAIILTDGADTCEGVTTDLATDLGSIRIQQAATRLADEGVTTYIIAFAINDSALLSTLDSAADNGGTDYARRATNRDELRAAFAEIVESAIRVEQCNNIDDDCDGEIDNIYRPCSTICEAGQQQCLGGSWGDCSAREPATETCNNIDDDCDGAIDEELTRDCSNDCGTGDETCVAGTWRDCDAPRASLEVCDGIDNDCDTDVDEDDPLLGEACGSSVGECDPGVWQCVDGELTCSGGEPEEETCNSLDDDCDGLTDESLTRDCSYNVHCPGVENCESGGWVGCTAPSDPLPAETCNNVDDDCDGSVDEDLTMDCSTACGEGTRTCTGGTWSACDAPVPSEEVCDGDDNDCDGLTDENVWRPCTWGTCSGWERCVGPDTWDDCTAEPADPTERCDGVDNDCDGDIDEDVTRACSSVCGAGEQVCTDGAWGACDAREPIPEECNDIDDDCDGSVDEGLTRACALDACTGEEHCDSGAWVGCTATSSDEVCDGVDNDCDGATDEGLSRACSTACGDGTETCSGGAWTGCTAPMPEVEICDGVDNDCDGETNEGVTRACTVGTCAGIQTCTGDDTWSECSVSSTPEVCNGVDDDCDGVIDEDPPGVALVRPCSTVCGFGTQTCVDGAWDTCTAETPSPEVCNGLDDDCNGLVDDGVTRSCSTICGDGLESCVDGFWGPCSAPEPTDEVCDGFDNDCDGDTDEDDPDLGEACGTDVGICELGYYACLGGVLDCLDDVEPTDEICDSLDNDCDGEADEGLPLGDLCDNDTGLGDTGQCEWGHFICSEGAVVCEGVVGPSDEVCDCIDNDCDTHTDEGLGGDPCGTDVGECELGYLACISCELVCVGETGPSPEVCDGRDNDCDGEIDEEGGSALCPEDEAACIEGECALPCGEGEFPCPAGRHCEDGFCIADRCSGVVCDECENCDPNTGECVDLCAGRTCDDGLVCECGRCVPDNCYYLGCPDDQLCVEGECVDDPCADVTCGEGEFCRDGDCIDLCTEEVVCETGQRCVDGACVDDPCATVTCEGGEMCDPETGECTDACRSVTCPPGQVCDPATQACIDDPCLLVDCPEGFECTDGTCTWVDDGGGDDDFIENTRVLATGGGGCTCDAASGGATASSWLLLIAPLGFVLRRLRGQGGAR